MTHNTDRLLDRMKSLARTFSVSDIQYVVVVILADLGIPAKLEGYHFLKTAIALYGEDNIRMVNNGLYVAVAKRYGKNTTKEMVEKCIHDAIRAGWEDRAGRMWDWYFAGTSYDKMKPPTNHEFIAEIARALELFVGLRKAYERELWEQEASHAVK